MRDERKRGRNRWRRVHVVDFRLDYEEAKPKRQDFDLAGQRAERDWLSFTGWLRHRVNPLLVHRVGAIVAKLKSVVRRRK